MTNWLNKWGICSFILFMRLFCCKKTLSFTASPSYKSISNILATGADKTGSSENESETMKQKAKGITRGADYYRR